MVSVSRRAGPPHCGQVALTKSGTFGERVAALARERRVLGSTTGSCSSGTGTTPSWSQ